MKYIFLKSRAALAVALLALAFMLPSEGALAQTAAKQPQFAPPQQWLDLGNGPLEVMPTEGNGAAYTSNGGAGVTGTSAASTALTLSGTPAVPPCIGCVITCDPTNAAVCTIPAATTVTAYNGTTGVTTSVATTTTAAKLVYGAACPASTAANVPGTFPGQVASLSSPLTLRAGGLDLGVGAFPLYSAARLCLYGLQNGLTALTFPIGAH